MKDRLTKFEPQLYERWWQVLNSSGQHVGSTHPTLDAAVWFMDKTLKKNIRKGCKIVRYETFVVDAIL